MSEQGRDLSIFRLEQQMPVNPLVVSSADLHASLGFQTKDSAEEVTQSRDFFNKTARKVIRKRQDSIFGHILTDDPARDQLEQPETHILEKNGRTYYEFVLGNKIRIIADSQPTETMVGNGARINGLIAEHIFLDGHNGQSIDLLSLRRGTPTRNMFTFSGVSATYSPDREYRGKTEDNMLPFREHEDAPEGVVRKSFGAEVILSPFTKVEDGKLDWDYDLFDFVVLHENAHPADQKDEEVDPVYRERRANAIALKTVRTINHQYPSDNFFDIGELRKVVANQLLEGYGSIRPEEEDATLDKDFIDKLGSILKSKLIES